MPLWPEDLIKVTKTSKCKAQSSMQNLKYFTQSLTLKNSLRESQLNIFANSENDLQRFP